MLFLQLNNFLIFLDLKAFPIALDFGFYETCSENINILEFSSTIKFNVKKIFNTFIFSQLFKSFYDFFVFSFVHVRNQIPNSFKFLFFRFI
jgi:hypothetical protein